MDTNALTHANQCTHPCTPMNTLMNTNVHTHTHAHACTNKHANACTNAHTHACTNAHAQACTNTHAHWWAFRSLGHFSTWPDLELLNLGRYQTLLYCDVEQYPESIDVPNMLVKALGSPIYFANVGYMGESEQLVLTNPLMELMEKFRASKLLDVIGKECIFMSVAEAVSSCRLTYEDSRVTFVVQHIQSTPLDLDPVMHSHLEEHMYYTTSPNIADVIPMFFWHTTSTFT
ncbi:hypothetical protein H6P81_003819 [Aristolochia fimbriata]|uniref:Uncharacterized protein n=1 Tax=Aristolochia fimbriata TaxID=158543 RepID=A0AAV7FGP9_ARIFI|nr:hypothetical protein H6P81_003819 [Aristolochia fimbriata]